MAEEKKKRKGRYDKSPKIVDKAKGDEKVKGDELKEGAGAAKDDAAKAKSEAGEPGREVTTETKGAAPKGSEESGTESVKVSEVHLQERKDMNTRHERERRDLNGRHEQEHKDMGRRHEKMKASGLAHDKVA